MRCDNLDRETEEGAQPGDILIFENKTFKLIGVTSRLIGLYEVNETERFNGTYYHHGDPYDDIIEDILNDSPHPPSDVGEFRRVVEQPRLQVFYHE